MKGGSAFSNSLPTRGGLYNIKNKQESGKVLRFSEPANLQRSRKDVLVLRSSNKTFKIFKHSKFFLNTGVQILNF